tara:strand:+ start:941 stop:1354 length:414 start_codon:yes stop_codon:yes gene_type:complete
MKQRIEIKAMFENIVDEVENGMLEPIEALIISKTMENCAKHLKELYTDEALIHAEKWSGQTMNGYEITSKNGATRYKFDHIEEYATFKDGLKQMESTYKDAYLSAQKGNVIVDSDGVIVPQAEPVFGKEQIVLKLSK